MGYGTIERREIEFFNAKNGRLWRGADGEREGKGYDYVEGKLMGVRYRVGPGFDGYAYTFDVRLADPIQAVDYIISTTIFTDEDGPATVFAAHLINVLANSENGIELESPIRICAYAPRDNKKRVTFCSVQHMGDPTNLPGFGIDRHDRSSMDSAVHFVCNEFGWPGKGPAHPDLDKAFQKRDESVPTGNDLRTALETSEPPAGTSTQPAAKRIKLNDYVDQLYNDPPSEGTPPRDDPPPPDDNDYRPAGPNF